LSRRTRDIASAAHQAGPVIAAIRIVDLKLDRYLPTQNRHGRRYVRVPAFEIQE
jgi:hypothetical protein